MKGNTTHKPVLLVALGGNAMIRKGQTGTIGEQLANLRLPIRQIARLPRDYRIIVTHDNGAYVGDLFMSIIHTCQLAGVNPLNYLTWVLKNLKKLQVNPSDFLPWNYQEGNLS